MTTCTGPECDRPRRKLTLCDTHYTQWRTKGELTPIRAAIRGLPHDCTRHQPGTTTCYAHHGCRCTPCRRQHARDHKAWMLRALRGQTETIDATGTVRRLRALCVIGWSRRELAAILGMEKSAVDRLVGGVEVCWRSTARRVAGAYETHWQGPPEPTTPHERACRTRTIGTAIKQGWAPPLAWDDIDDPAATPQTGDTRRKGATIEEIAWCIETGETHPEAIARRVGIATSSVRDLLHDHHRDDLIARLGRAA